jgi:hypothetical protein
MTWPIEGACGPRISFPGATGRRVDGSAPAPTLHYTTKKPSPDQERGTGLAPPGGLIGSLGAAQPITPALRWAAGARLRHGTNVGPPCLMDLHYTKKAPPRTSRRGREPRRGPAGGYGGKSAAAYLASCKVGWTTSALPYA